MSFVPLPRPPARLQDDDAPDNAKPTKIDEIKGSRIAITAGDASLAIFTAFMGKLNMQVSDVQLITVGRKGQDFMARRGRTIRATFTHLGDRPEYMSIVPIARVVIDDFESGRIDAAYLLYPKFISTLAQRPQIDQMLPIAPPAETPGGQRAAEYIYEPDPRAILDELLPRYVEVQIFQAVLETIASEQSARMVAMRAANDNAKELIDGLTLTYNRARQAAITAEVNEIASAANAR